MKRLIGVATATIIAGNSLATPILNFKISKPLCLLTFIEAASGDPHASSTLKQYVRDNVKGADSTALSNMCKAFSSLGLETNYTLGQVPSQRVKPKNINNLIKIAAVQTDSLHSFYDRITGILPNEQMLLLKSILTRAEPIYDKIIWQQYGTMLEVQLTSLRQYGTETDSAFARLKKFYSSSWPDDMPFAIGVYPVPGVRGNTTATPHNNSIVLAVLTGEKDYDARIGVAMHEICHVLYEEQAAKTQWLIDSLFNMNTSLFAPYAYNYFDEALATACGNGWMYEILAGKTDTGSWYTDAYIDKYAHGLYSVVKDYLGQNRSMDAEFISTAVSVFEQQFPGAAYEYDNLFNRMHFYTDADNDEQYRSIMNMLNEHYKISSCNSSYPINDEKSLD